MAFLFDMGIMQKLQNGVDGFTWRSLYILIQKAHYQSSNIRKLEACVRLYGGLMEVYPEAVERLMSMLLHRYPQIRNKAADVVFVAKGVGKRVNWLVAKKEDVAMLKRQLVAVN
jgi:hypothetical protein